MPRFLKVLFPNHMWIWIIPIMRIMSTQGKFFWKFSFVTPKNFAWEQSFFKRSSFHKFTKCYSYAWNFYFRDILKLLIRIVLILLQTIENVATYPKIVISIISLSTIGLFRLSTANFLEIFYYSSESTRYSLLYNEMLKINIEILI